MLKIIPDTVMSELERAAEQAALNVRDPQTLADACERMDRTREEIRRRHGELNLSVDLVRDSREDA